MSSKKKRERSNLPIEINPFTLATQVTKQVVANNENYNELVSDLESQNESETDSNNEIKPEPLTNPLILYCKWYEKAKFNNIFTEGTSWFKEQYLIRHLNSKDHQKAQEIETHIQLTINESIRKPLSVEKLKVIQNMRNMYWLVENNIATLNLQDLCNLVETQIQNKEDYIISTSACTIRPVSLTNIIPEKRYKYGSYSNNHAGHDFIEAIARVIEESTIKELTESLTWSIMIDESTTITNEKNLAIVSKHLVQNIPYYRYLGMIQLTSGTADAIINELLRFFIAKNLPTKTLFHMGSDGASVMLATQLKALYPFLTEHHCISHRLALAGKDAAKKVPYFSHYEYIVKKLYTYFSTSFLRMQNLKMIEKEFGDPELVLLQIVTTRWLSFSNVVKNLHQIINSVVEALLEDSLTDKIAEFLYLEIDNNFYLTTYYLADIMGYLRRLTLLFQANYVSLFDMKLQLNSTIQAITTEFIGEKDIAPTWGTHLKNYLIEKNIDDFEIPLFVQDFAKAVIESLNERFPDHNLIDAFCIFDPKELPSNKSMLGYYGQESIQKLINFYGVTKFIKDNEISAIINGTELLQEWSIFRSLLYNFQNFKLYEAWQNIFKIENFKILYPNISILASLLLILPLSNAYVERVFSYQNNIKTKLRNRIQLETLNDLLIISLNGPSIELFDFEKAYNYWISNPRYNFI
ncbi:8780_t:CDS:2 [Scutellospora calospora]|uniref:8780_t:CDS:1 n=1 Tax=Scutellospora calospora TaxID=85575 RepID=A0ACA9K7R7_9GLOM|nr:8780_t:CDS:2 [Scutellospora calospora]